MKVTTTRLSAALLLLIVSCSPYKQEKFAGGNNPEAENVTSEGGQSSGNSEPAKEGENGKLEAKTPTEAQRDMKTFLALTDEEALHGLKDGEEQLKIVCDRNAGKVNRLTTAFCTNKVRPKSLVELQQALGIALQQGQTASLANGGPGYALQGHSSSLVGRFVSAINPRVILFSPRSNDNVVLGFVRGEQLAEIAVRNTDGSFDFFIAAFKQACNAKPEGCSPAETLTPAVESNWTAFTIYQDEDLKNSIVDCRHCHQPDGPSSPKILRMQELRNPWLHWFRNNTTGGQQLIADYQAAHGTQEIYGGIPANAIPGSDPADLETFVRGNGFQEAGVTTQNQASQPNQFNTTQIPTEIAAATRAQVTFLDEAACKVSKTAPSPSNSPTWDGLLFNAMNHTNACLIANQVPAGTVASKKNFIPPPYHSLRVTDPALLTKYTNQYKALAAGTLPPAQFEDHREIFPADQKVVSQMGFAVDPDLAPQEILKLACGQCHHSDLDQGLSRAKFNALDFSKMANLNQELDIAISRVKLGYSPARLKAEGLKIIGENGAAVEMHKAEHLLTMPPRRFRQLTDAQIDSLVKYFESQKK